MYWTIMSFTFCNIFLFIPWISIWRLNFHKFFNIIVINLYDWKWFQTWRVVISSLKVYLLLDFIIIITFLLNTRFSWIIIIQLVILIDFFIVLFIYLIVIINLNIRLLLLLIFILLLILLLCLPNRYLLYEWHITIIDIIDSISISIRSVQYTRASRVIIIIFNYLTINFYYKIFYNTSSVWSSRIHIPF